MVKKEVFETRVCRCGCEEAFGPTREHQVYVSAAHRMQHWRERHLPSKDNLKTLIRQTMAEMAVSGELQALLGESQQHGEVAAGVGEADALDVEQHVGVGG